MDGDPEIANGIGSTDSSTGGAGGVDDGRTPSFTNAYRIPRHEPKKHSIGQTLLLGFQSLGVVYGDLGTSPLYVFPSITMSNAGEKDILGILSLIFWTLTMMALVKYVLIVLHADDHGEGGTFALYSLLRQHITFKSKNIVQITRLDSDVNLLYHSRPTSFIQTKTKEYFEKTKKAQNFLTLIVLIGTSMLIGDGALTPAISVLSAVQGIQSRSTKIKQEHVVLLSVMILAVLFLLQRFGTSKVSATFSPIMMLWFLSNSFVGLYNIFKYHPSVLKGLSPHYIYYFFSRNGRKGWELLGAIVLCITGAEAMFADLGHFSKGGIQFAFSCIVYPALIITYSGQAAYLVKNPQNMSTAFYSAIPGPVFWPMFIIATLSAIVASQSLISASFSIIRQSMALGCFPRVTIVHTSGEHEGQIYSPEVNYFLMFVCILLTVVFKGGIEIANAFGVAVIWVMIITTSMMIVVMLVVWNTNIVLVVAFASVFFLIEGTYMTSLLNKVPQGGWVPFIIAAFLMVVQLSWTYGRSKKSAYEAERKISHFDFDQLIKSTTVHRVPGLCFFCTDLINGIPPIVRHYIEHVGSLRQVTVMVTVRILPIKTVLQEERFVAAKMGQRGMYRCLVQYGYMDVPDLEGGDFVASLIEALKQNADDQEEIEMLEYELSKGVVYVMGRTILKKNKNNGRLSHLVIDNVYRFLQKNFRSTMSTLQIPPAKVLQVGMVYKV